MAAERIEYQVLYRASSIVNKILTHCNPLLPIVTHCYMAYENSEWRNFYLLSSAQKIIESIRHFSLIQCLAPYSSPMYARLEFFIIEEFMPENIRQNEIVFNRNFVVPFSMFHGFVGFFCHSTSGTCDWTKKCTWNANEQSRAFLTFQFNDIWLPINMHAACCFV